MKKTKTILLLTILLFGLFLTINFVQAAEEEKTESRALEIVYPQIPGAITPKTVASGLPEYVDYIFRFSVVLIGLVILGVFIYSGFQHFTSFGSPEKLTNAKQGITAALLGAVILLSAYLIFNTINPQLVILETTPPDVIEPVVTDGIYLCNYKVLENIASLIGGYKSENEETKIEAAKKLKEVMQNKNGSCFKVNYSANLANFVFDPSRHTIFAIPRQEFVYIPATETEPAKTDIEWKYDYGIIFHQENNFKGRCNFVPLSVIIQPEGNEPLILASFKKAKSVTIFQRPTTEPYPESEGVILYQCLGYNDAGISMCAGTIVEGEAKRGSFKTFGDFYRYTGTGEGPKGGLNGLYENTRSIKIDPVGFYFAVLFSEDDFKGETCEVISKNDNNLLDNPIGRCGDSCYWISSNETVEGQLKYCVPCLKSMIVIKGKVL